MTSSFIRMIKYLDQSDVHLIFFYIFIHVFICLNRGAHTFFPCIIMVDYCRPKAPIFYDRSPKSKLKKTKEKIWLSKSDLSCVITCLYYLRKAKDSKYDWHSEPAGPTWGSPGLNHQIISFNYVFQLTIDGVSELRIDSKLGWTDNQSINKK